MSELLTVAGFSKAAPLDESIAALRRSAGPTTVLGTRGVEVFGGYVQTHERDRRLVGPEKWKTYGEILANVAVVSAGVRYFLGLIGKSAWNFRAPEGSGSRGEELADRVSKIMTGMRTPWTRTVRRLALSRFYGFAAGEWSMKKSEEDGALVFADVGSRPQWTIERWDLDVDGHVVGVLQRNPQDQSEHYIPRSKLIYMVDDALSDSPEGLGLFRHLVEPVSRLQRLEELECVGYQVDLRGMPVIRMPRTLLAAQVKSGAIRPEHRAEIEQPLIDFARNHVAAAARALILDSAVYTTTDEKGTPSSVPMFSAELMKSGATSLDEIGSAIQRVCVEVARIIGTEHLLLGADGKGSLALSKDKSGNFATLIDGTLSDSAEVVKADLVRPLFLVNGWPLELMPTPETETAQWREIAEITDALESLARAGAVLDPEDPAINQVRHMLGLDDAIVAEIDTTGGALGSGRPEPDEEPEPEDDEVDEELPEPQGETKKRKRARRKA